MRRAIAIGILAALVVPVEAESQERNIPDPSAALASLRWRSIGPANMGGRVTDIAGIPGKPSLFYVAAADGGIFKTTNGGVTFEPVFDGQAVLSVGAIAVSPSDSNVIWAGTGEGNVRNSASFGNGVYRSTDAGATWTHLGLTDTERIARIRVDPRDPDTAYVAAMGHEWGPNEERGLFKTTDGGKTWSKVLYLDPDTGCSDVDLDVSNPRILYAGMYTYRRRPWRFDGGGGQTALYRSIDGGATWKKLTTGLPTGPMDRIGVAIARSQPETVYMITESKTEGVLFRSDDRGDSWRKVHDDPNINFRPFYYSDIRVDPNDALRVYALGGGLSLSRDGGKTFARIAGEVHPDHHALWIDPLDSNRVLNGNDGGIYASWDGARTFEFLDNLVISQFYHVNYDLRQPYYVCGGLQDNYNWCGPSATASLAGIRTSDWFTLTFGDGFFAVPDPSAPHLVYTDTQGGNITLTDTRTGTHRSIHPHPVEIGSSGNAVFGYKYRFSWNAPIVLSPHDPKTVYFGGNVVFRSKSQGQSWDVISPDLTTDDKAKQQSSGGPVASDNTAAEFHCTILTIAESPVTPGVIWVGTDDGQVQVTRDGGKSWTNVTGKVPGLPPHSWIPAIEASHFDAGIAYMAVDRHRDDDFKPYVFRTTDYGQTWSLLRGNLPEKGYVHVVREDPKNRNLLYAGTELGVFASWDGGGRWSSIRMNLPPVAVRDLLVHSRDNDLILATHGRGAWILDDVTPLQQIGQAQRADAHLFDVRPAIRFQIASPIEFLGRRNFVGENPPSGALISYYLARGSKDAVSLTILDSAGTVIRHVRGASAQPGVNRVAWDLRHEGPVAAAGEGSGGGGGGLRFGPAGGPLVLPGQYTVKLVVGGREQTRSVQVNMDPRVETAASELQAQRDALLTIRDLTTRVNGGIDRVADLTRQLETLAAALERAAAPLAGTDGQAGRKGPAQVAVTRALAEINALRMRLMREVPALTYRYPPKLREELQSLGRAIGGPAAAPTDAQRARLAELAKETDAAIGDLNTIVTKTIAEVNTAAGSLPRVFPGLPVR